MAVLRWTGLFLLFTAIGLIFFNYYYLDDLARQIHGTAERRFIEEMTGAYAALVLFPFVAWMARRFSCWTGPAWLRTVAAHGGGLVIYSAAHTTLMAISRALIFPAAHLGTYDYGIMLFRYPMEASHDVLAYVVMAGAVIASERVRRARAAELASARLAAELAEAKLENLRLQLQPHFLFNALNAISAVMYENPATADTMLARLSDFLRAVLASSDRPEVSLEEELEIEQMYLDVMRGRLESGLRLNVAADADARAARVPSLLLQPLLENAIRHGMRAGGAGLEISISANRRIDALEIDVNDNGAGYAPNPASNGGGRGLSNVRSRLAHFYGDDYRFSIVPLERGGTTVTLQLPYKTA